VIADNVGDNVGDVAGMGADLFESNVASIVASAALGVPYGHAYIALPFQLAAAGILSSMFGVLCVSTRYEGKGWSSRMSKLMWAINKGMYVASFIFLSLAATLIILFWGPDGGDDAAGKINGWRLFSCVVMGWLAGISIGRATEYFTSIDFGPVQSLKDRVVTGPATVVIQGLGIGMISCVPPTVILVIVIIVCNVLAGAYGLSLAAVGMVGTLGVTIAADAYGPIADNACGLAEMAGCDESVREKTDSLDALGNQTAAIGRGFAIGSAVLTSLALLGAFKQQLNLNSERTGKVIFFDLGDPLVLSGLLFGAMLPLLFSALTMISVGKAAACIILEVRRQLDQLTNQQGVTLRKSLQRPNIGETKSADDHVNCDADTCIQMATRASVKEIFAPGAYAVLAPLLCGFLVGPKCLMGLLAGTLVTGCMLATLMCNAGSAWNNSRKLCEKLKSKKNDEDMIPLARDLVGDPFKETSGPALNILMKLMCTVSLLIAPIVDGNDDWENWFYGVIPFAIFVILTGALVWKQILTWQDPLELVQDKLKEADVGEHDKFE